MQRRDRRFSLKELIREAAGLVLDQGYIIPEACQAMDVGRTAISRWAQQFQEERNGVTPRTKALTPEYQRIPKLEAQNQINAPQDAIITNKSHLRLL